MPKKPLNDGQVYELLHDAYLLLSGAEAETGEGKIILARLVAHLEANQKAIIILHEGDGVKPPLI